MPTFIDDLITQIKLRPDKAAIMDRCGSDSYGQLNMRSAVLARHILDACREAGTDVEALRREGKSGARVAVLLPRTREYVTALVAVVRAGCCVVPIDAGYQKERICTILNDAGCTVCVTTLELADKAGIRHPIILDEVIQASGQEGAEENLNMSDADIEGLLLFTSGSSGKPKGVLHTQAVFLSSYKLLGTWHDFGENDVIGSMSGFTFIASIHDIIPPLVAGGSIYIMDENERKNVDVLFNVINKRKITGMYLPPSLFAVMRDMYGPLPLSYILLAGEKNTGRYPDDGNIIEAYGSTEASGILSHRVGEDMPNVLGRPYGEVRVYLLDENDGLIRKPGVAGELCVVNPWLACGYINLEEETKDRFVDCPFEPGQQMYRTGDFMMYDEEGNLVFIGRKDRMIKLRGYRVELGEIESVFNRMVGVDEAVCVRVKVGGGDKLCLYYTGEKKEQADLKTYAGEFLPEYMVPDFAVWLEEMPRNERDKVDYRKLQDMEPPVEDGDYKAPETETERKVCDAFSAALGLSRVSVTADFFNLGGTSISVALLISKLSDMRKGLSFQDVVSHPTPEALAAYIAEASDEKKIVREMDREFYPLTKTQMGIYLEALTGGSSSTYSSPYLMKADPSISADQLIKAVNMVVSAHPSMKYVIRTGDDGIPHMFMAPDLEMEIPVIDGTEEERMDFMNRFMPVVPMTDGLLFHFAVYRTPERCYLALKSHLIFLDGTSISIIISELNRALTGAVMKSEECTIQQVGMLEEQLLKDGTHEAAQKYYTDLFKEMDDLPVLSGDIEGALTPGVSENLRYEPHTLEAERVKAFCDRNRITESSFFLGAMALMLGKYLNSKHVSFSTVYNGRALAQTADTIGTLIKRIPVYGDLSKNLTVAEYLKGISRQVFANMSNDIYSFDEILKTCPVNEDVEFIYQGDLFTDNMGTAAGENLIEGDKWFMEHYHTGMVTGCMSIQFFSTAGMYNMTIEYRNEKFSSKWVERFAKDLFIIAEGLLTHEKIGDIEMLSEDDRKILGGFNDTGVEMEFIPVHEQIHKWALETPDKTAVIGNGEKLSFKEFDLISDKLAMRLKDKGVKAGSLVGVLFDREIWAYAAEIGILKVGGAFVPFIPDYPDERIDYCMKDGNIRFLLTADSIKKEREGLAGRDYEVIAIQELCGDLRADGTKVYGDDDECPDVKVGREDLAYCIYTSGTTGRPKGVMIEHGNIRNYVHRNEKSTEIMHYGAPGQVCLALASFSFDVSVVEEFVPLCNGNTVVIATEEEIHTPSKLAGLIKENGVTGITCTPTYLLSLLDIPETKEAIRQLTFFDIGAEAFPARLYDRLRELREDSVILNVYGPTEATMGCAAEEMTDSMTVTVGPPIANTYFYISDTFGNELPAGIRGELIICGDQVGRGYINLPDKTAAAFFKHNGMRAYHSGDLAAWTNDGKIRIFGRVDNQVKLRGFRIELDEVEKVLEEHPLIGKAAAAVKKSNGTEYLTGYYTSQDEIPVNELKEYLKEKLPEYMVPSMLMQLKVMPVTTNGKVDRKALPLPDLTELRTEYVAPETEAEKAICHAFAVTLDLPEDRVGGLDDFFELGGDSLKAMRAASEADIEGLTAANVFRNRTPRAIAEALNECSGQADLDEREEMSRKTAHPLSPFQIQMIDTQLFSPGSTMWNNVHFLVKFDPADVDADRLCMAVNRAVNNHPVLSTAITIDDNNDFVQQYIPGLVPEVKVRDIRRETAENLSDVLVLPFDRLLDACLCRLGVFRSPDHVYLFMDIHHLLLDGGSLGVLLEDVVNAYYGRELKKDYYFAILAEEEKHIKDGSRERDRKWFLDNYEDEFWCKMPPVKQGKESIKIAGLEKRLSIDGAMIGEAERYWGVSHSVMANTAALLALYRTTGRPHVMINWIFNNRLMPGSDNAVGMLIKNLPAAARMEEFTTVRELMASVKEQVAEGIAHDTYDFMTEQYRAFEDDCLVVNLQLGINGDELDVFKPTLVFLDDEFAVARTRLEIKLLENEYRDGGFDLRIEYAEGLFDKEDMEAFHNLYVEILEGMIHKTIDDRI